jgi:hypothetical protein
MDWKVKRKIRFLISHTATFIFYAWKNLRIIHPRRITVTDSSHYSSKGRGLFSLLIEILDIISIDGMSDVEIIYHDTLYNENFSDNMWEYYFEPINNRVKKKYRILRTLRPYRDPLIIESEKIRNIFSEIFKDRIQIKESILNKTEKYFKKTFFTQKILGIHYRATDIRVSIKTHPEILKKESIEKYFEFIDLNRDKYENIFLATDDENISHLFQAKYPDKIVISPSEKSINDISLHKEGSNRRKKGEEALFDAIILSKCSFLLHGHSNLANFSLILNKNLEHRNLDLR